MLTIWNLRTLPQRWRGGAVVIIGFLGVVLVFAAVLSIREGLWQSSHPAGGDQVAAVIGHDRALDQQAFTLVTRAPGIARKAGRLLVAPTYVAVVVMENWKPGLFAAATLRGITPTFASIIPHFHLLSGRMFRPGTDEVIVGTGGKSLFSSAAEGGSLLYNHRRWRIVGTFRSGQANIDSEFLTDLNQLQAADGAGQTYTEILVKLTNPAAFGPFKHFVERQKGMAVNAETLNQRYMDFTGGLTSILLVADGVITSLMAIGAIFGVLNVMNASVASRAGQFGTLRALGFSRFAVLGATLAEALMLALVGGGLGLAMAYLLFNGMQASTQAGALIAFRFMVTVRADLFALGLALAMGLAGGLFPAIRAARQPVAAVLRES